jgi:hypothetical protein
MQRNDLTLNRVIVNNVIAHILNWTNVLSKDLSTGKYLIHKLSKIDDYYDDFLIISKNYCPEIKYSENCISLSISQMPDTHIEQIGKDVISFLYERHFKRNVVSVPESLDIGLLGTLIDEIQKLIINDDLKVIFKDDDYEDIFLLLLRAKSLFLDFESQLITEFISNDNKSTLQIQAYKPKCSIFCLVKAFFAKIWDSVVKF